MDAAPAATGSRLLQRLLQPRSNASLELFRILFGALMAFGCARFLLQGWVAECYGKPQVFLKYWGFGWVPVWPEWGMTLHYSALILCALALSLGFKARLAAALFTLGFAFVQLMDVTNYLNHYVLVVLLGAWLSLMPIGGRWSIDSWLRGAPIRVAPGWCLAALRFQLGCVYVFAGLAKVHPDWLLGGQPLGIWMASRNELPIIGPWLGEGWVVMGMSWAACLYDLSIPFWLLWRRTRAPAFLVLLGFHGMTGVFFDIGLFPAIMTLGATLFFDPQWPLLRARAPAPAIPAPSWTPRRRLAVGLAALVILAELLIPLRHLAFPGDVLWTEEGMRWSWRVMVREKNGAITYRLRKRGEAREWQVNPLTILEHRQYKEMSGQPDLILQVAHIIAERERQRGLDVEVRVDALVSLNGRRSRLLIDPEVDLTQVRNGFGPSHWILAAPAEPPLEAGLARAGR